MRTVRLVLIVLALAALVVLVRRADVSPEAIALAVAPFGIFAPLAFLGLAAVRPLVGLPGITFTVAAALAWGPILGTLLAATACTIGGVVAFVVARRLGRERVEERLEAYPRIRKAMHRAGFKTVFVAHAVPMIPYDPIHYAAGVGRLRLGSFALATFLGALPGTYLYAIGTRALLGI